MAIIRIRASDGHQVPQICEIHREPERSKDYFEFQDVSDDELAFWNSLTEKQRERVGSRSYERCLHEVLEDTKKEEAEDEERARTREKFGLV